MKQFEKIHLKLCRFLEMRLKIQDIASSFAFKNASDFAFGARITMMKLISFPFLPENFFERENVRYYY